MKSLKTVDIAPQVQPQQFMNNINENPRIFTSTSFAAASMVLGVSSFPPIFVNKYKKMESLGEMIVTALPFHVALAIFFPMVVYISNEKVRTFVWNQLVPASVRNTVANLIAKFQTLAYEPDKPPENDSGIELQA